MLLHPIIAKHNALRHELNHLPAPPPSATARAGMTDDDDQRRPLSLREVIGSVMAALLGVQSSRAHARDFTRGSARQYIVAGLIATALFILVVFTAVKLILHLAAS